MRMIDTNELVPGKITEYEYYGVNNELLLSKGVTISERHLEILRRRNIFEIYIKDEESELQRILRTDFKKLDTITEEQERRPREPERKAKAFELITAIRDVKAGEEGLRQLLASQAGSELDRELRSGRAGDRPVGPPLKERLSQITPSERTPGYKGWVEQSYKDALGEVRLILNRLADVTRVDGSAIRVIVERFMKTFISDRNILLNLSAIKHDGGDDYLYHHTLNVCLLSINIATASGYSEEQVIQIGMGALLHDIGMLLVPREIRQKEGRLTNDEWFEIQKHPILGLHILEKVSHLPEAVPFVAYQIHERENGKGYPKQRVGRWIHCYAKVVQTADIFEAVSSPRCYRSAYAPYAGMEMLIKMTQQGLLDGQFVKAFLTYTSLFPVGSLVELSDHKVGKVIAANGTSFTKPTISIMMDEHGNHLDDDRIYQVNLSSEIDVQIVRALPLNYLNGAGIMQGF